MQHSGAARAIWIQHYSTMYNSAMHADMRAVAPVTGCSINSAAVTMACWGCSGWSIRHPAYESLICILFFQQSAYLANTK